MHSTGSTTNTFSRWESSCTKACENRSIHTQPLLMYSTKMCVSLNPVTHVPASFNWVSAAGDSGSPGCGARAPRGDRRGTARARWLSAAIPADTSLQSFITPRLRQLQHRSLPAPGGGLPLQESSTAHKGGCCRCRAHIIGSRVAVNSWLRIKMVKQYRVQNSCPNGDDGCGGRTLWWWCSSPCWYFDKINDSVLTRIWQRDNQQQGTWSCLAKPLSELQEFPYSMLWKPLIFFN